MISRETLLFAMLASLSVGCAIGQRASFPSMSSQSGWKQSFLCFYQGCPEARVVAVFSNTDIELVVKSHNNSFYRPANDYFAITFLVNSKLNLTVNLAEFQSVLTSGERITPGGFMIRKLGPANRREANRWMDENYFSRGDITMYPTYHKVTRDLYKVMPETCYDLFFGTTPPKPGEKFYLNIRGVILGGRRYEIPSIEFD